MKSDSSFSLPSSRTHLAGLGLRSLLTGLVGLLVLSAIGPGLTALSVLKGQKEDAVVINIAGRQRMLSQKMTKEALSLAAGVDAAAQQSLAQSRDLFDTSLKGLIYGDAAQHLPPSQDSEILAQMHRVETLWKEFAPKIQTLLGTSKDSAEFAAALEFVVKNNTVLLKEMNTAVGLYETAAQAKVARLKALIIGGITVALTVAVLCWVVVTRRIILPVKRIRDQIDALGRGELDNRLNLGSTDELGQTARHLDEFADNLRDEILTAFNRLSAGDFTFEAKGLIRTPLADANKALNEVMGRIRQAAGKIAQQSTQVAETSSSLSQGATEAASSLEEIAASINEMDSQITRTADNAAKADGIARNAQAAAESGNEKMQQMIIAMGEINQSSRNISKIIKVIDEIAFQTNLLALNAAVEAARAGQHGKGFAVVAEEVRNLAARSAKAAKETADLIEGSVQKVEAGAIMADQTGEALDHINTNIVKVSKLVTEISSAGKEQALGISQINIGINQIDNVTQQNTANSEEAAAAAEELSALARQLEQMLQGFRLDGNSMEATHSARPVKHSRAKGIPRTETPQIALDAREFGKY